MKTKNKRPTLSQPSKLVERNDWPSGIRRVYARFEVQLDPNQRRERVSRQTAETRDAAMSHPKRTAYGLYACIATDEDGHTWCVVMRNAHSFTLTFGTMQGVEVIAASEEPSYFRRLLELIEATHGLGRCACCGSLAHRDGRCVTQRRIEA